MDNGMYHYESTIHVFGSLRVVPSLHSQLFFARSKKKSRREPGRFTHVKASYPQEVCMVLWNALIFPNALILSCTLRPVKQPKSLKQS